MNKIANEIRSYFGSANMTDEEYLEHYGTPRHSGRYPWGSGKDPYQHSVDFLSRVETLRKKGWSEKRIAEDFGLSMKELRMEKTLCLNARRSDQIATAERLKYKEGLSNSEIGRKMGINESSVRSLLDEKKKINTELAKNTAEFIKNRIESFPKDKQMIDVGSDVEHSLNISRTKLDTALYMLESEGYGVYSNRIPQVTNPGQYTTQKIICGKEITASKPPTAEVPKQVYDYANIQTLKDYISRDGGKTYEKKFNYPASLDSKRMMVRYADDKGPDGFTGLQKDGTIEIRRGVPDLDLGESRYAQVRILVDGTHYAKGMAVYSDDMPPGIDVVFNTNKPKGTPLKNSDPQGKQVLKTIKNDPDNPFGSAIKDVDQGGQYWYDSKTGKRLESKSESKNAKLGLINKRADEGDWTEWKDALPSQFLSKQPKYLVEKQLNLAKATKQAEFEEYKSLTNPVIKKYYLEEFANKCDKAAVDLKAASLPGQKYHVIIPINSLKDNEIYAPQYEPGTTVALIRYPHGGTFEIPKLIVNNKNALGRKIIGTKSIDAVGINKNVADRLSGADFDGDTVMVIPTDDKKGKVRIKSRDLLDGLKGFDSKMYQYSTKTTDKNGKDHYYDKNGKEIKIMKNTDTQMGIISNLITDMTLLGAKDEHIERAVRHSMVVIDAEKHKLDYQKSYKDNNIKELANLYQLKVDDQGNLKAGGASTIVSSAKGEVRIPKTKGQPKVNQKGKEWYDPTKPEGSLIYKIAPPKELYYADSKFDKSTHKETVTLSNGKKITYDRMNAAERNKYEPVMHIDKKTGDVYFTSKDGTLSYKKKIRTVNSTRMAQTDDAMTLVSKNRHTTELLYADYANSMKALANKARLEAVKTPNMQIDPNAKKIYKNEVDSLMNRLNQAKSNAPIERAAQRLSNVEIKNRIEADPLMKSSDKRKLSQRSVSKYRDELGTISRRNRAITISDKEWTAIQSGAISSNKLKEILRYTDPDSLRKRAMPKEQKGMTQAQINRIKSLADSNFTLQEIANKMNISTSQVSKYLKGDK